MKFILSFLILFITSFNGLNAQSISQKTKEALDYISNGYICYGVEELKKLANVNDIVAQFYLAESYNLGIGTQVDKNSAFKLYRRVAERGLCDAMSRLSIIYKEGTIVTRDEKKAIEWENRFRNKGGRLLLTEFTEYINEGLKFPQNYTLNPNKIDNKISNPQETVTVNNISIIQSPLPLVSLDNQQNISNSGITEVSEENLYKISRKSEVDELNNFFSKDNLNTFVLIIANENYHDVEIVPNATHDGEIFKEYCNRLLGIPENNIHFVKDATLNNIKREINLISQIAEEFKGEINIILYYAGHGIPDEKTKDPYLVPIDGFSTDITTCYSTVELYSKLGHLPANKIVVFMDACFSGSLRGDGMLASARGISIKSNSQEPRGKMVIFSAAQGDETAYSYEEEGHGMFTYYLLKHLKESNGEIKLKDLAEKIESDVRKKSLLINGKRQTPTVQYSSQIQDSWYDWKLKE